MKYLLWSCLAVLLCAVHPVSGAPRPAVDAVIIGKVVVGGYSVQEYRVGVTSQQTVDSIIATRLLPGGTGFEVLSVGVQRGQPDSVVCTIRFTPGATGPVFAELEITYADMQSGTAVLTVPLQAEGINLRISDEELDFGQLTASSSDVVTKRVRVFNDGIAPLVLSLSLAGTATPPPFRIASPEMEIAAESELPIDIECVAAGQNVKEGVVELRDSLLIGVRGNTPDSNKVVVLKAAMAAPVLDTALTFGRVLVGTSQTSTFVFTNTTNEPLQILRTAIEASDDAFRFAGGAVSRRVQPNERFEVAVQFTPRYEGDVEGAFALAIDNQGVPGRLIATVALSGQGSLIRPPVSRVGTVRAATGEDVLLPVTTTFAEDDLLLLQQSEIDALRYSFLIRLNASIAEVGGAIDTVTFADGEQVVAMSGQIARADLATPLVLHVPLRVLLGDADSTRVSIDTVLWTIAGTDFSMQGVADSSGALVVTDIFTWPNGQKRLINTRKGGLQVVITPNPASDEATVQVGGFSGRAVLTVYTALGEEVERITLKESGVVSLRISSWGTGKGVYYCRLSSGSNSLVKLLQVE